jgi:hypothetical protein
MKKSDWGERGNFRKVTVTLPPEVYDALVQESARRKSARDPNHLLSAIARESFEHRQPLLPIEKTELNIYRAADAQRPWFELPTIHELAPLLRQPNDIVADLLIDLHRRGWVLMDKYSQDARCYVPFAHWHDTQQFFREPGTVRLQVTIPGRRRKEGLETKEHVTRMQDTEANHADTR